MTNPADRAPAISLLLAHNEIHFATRGDFRLIDTWLQVGCDMLKDIVPAMKETISRMEKRNQKITSVAYCEPEVMKARDRRLSIEAARSFVAAPEGPTEEFRAKGIAWRMRKLGRLFGPDEARWLKEYEQKHGEVLV